jgi:hypothetical protein
MRGVVNICMRRTVHERLGDFKRLGLVSKVHLVSTSWQRKKSDYRRRHLQRIVVPHIDFYNPFVTTEKPPHSATLPLSCLYFHCG